MCSRFLTSIVAIVSLLSVTSANAFMAPSLPILSTLTHSYNMNYGSSLWANMRSNFELQDDAYMPAVRREIHWWQQHQGYLYDMLTQSQPYIYYVFAQTRNRHLPAELALLPFVESQYNPFAYSSVGAMGLWQMMPGTASGFGIKINWWYDGRRDVVTSTSAALDYLTYLYNFFDQNWQLAIAAYDSGEGTVLDAVRHNEREHRRTDFWNLPLPEETRDYLPKLLALAAIIKNPNQYNIELPYISDRSYFAAVDVHSQIDISEAAKLADVSVSTIRSLNPGFRRWATDPDGPYDILVPVAKTKFFIEHLNYLPKKDRVTWRHYYIRHGDTLDKIARKFHTDIPIIKQVNGLTSDIIHLHQSLLIPESFHGSIHSELLRERATIAEVDIPGPQRSVYIVKPGNTLWSIAKQFNLNTRQIRFWNNLSSKHAVSSGERLTLWVKKHHWFHSHTINYTVRSGDNLSKIAKEFNTTASKIKKLNYLHSDLIHVKQNLKIPTDIRAHSRHVSHQKNRHRLKREIYHVRIGDTLDVIARRLGVKVKSIISWNHIKNPKDIHPKQALVIYRVS